MSRFLSRRAFLKGAGLGAVAFSVSGGGPLFLRRAARAAAAPGPFHRRKVLVAIFQRGAMDGLMAVPPLGDGRLGRLRPRLGMSASRRAGEEALIDLDGAHGLHPALEALHPFFREGRLAVVHGMGSPDPTRSHFDAQDYMETGTPGRKGTRSGWLNRACGLLGHEGTPLRAVSVTRALPRSLHGEEPAIAVSDLADLRLAEDGLVGTGAAGRGFEALYAETSQELLRSAGRESFEVVDLLARLDLEGYRPAGGARYPSSPLGDALRQIAQLIKAEVGLEVAFAESGGWDTHVAQGTVNGTFARRARDLAESVAAFWADLGTYQDDVVLMTMTEFGRTVAENGSGGTDHGHASASFVLGHGIRGGVVHGSLPPLTADALFEGRDLPVAVDFRSLFAGVAGPHLGIRDDAALFPGWDGSRFELHAA